MHRAALAIHREVGNRRSAGALLTNLGLLNEKRGRIDDARRYLEAAVQTIRDIGNPRLEGIALGDLGRIEARGGNHPRAAEALARSELLLRGVGDPPAARSAARRKSRRRLARG